MSKFEASDKDRLSELLSQKLSYFEQIYELCRQQTQLLSEEEIEKFDITARNVQKLRDKINGLHQELDLLMQSYVTTEQNDTAINELISKTQDIIEQCAGLNGRNTEILAAMIENQSEKIEKQSTKRKTIGGYAQQVPNNPEVFDKKT